MIHLLKTSLIAALVLMAVAVSAQTRDSLQLIDSGRPLPLLHGIVVKSNAELFTVYQSLRQSSYPVFLLPEESVRSTVNSFNAKDRLLLTVQEENRILSHRDTLSMLESRKLNDIIVVNKRHIALCDTTNIMLNRSIEGLNMQLNETRQLANDCNKLRSTKSIWATVLGVGIGFGLGVLLGVAAN